MAIVFVLHPANNDIRVCCLDLQLYCDSVSTSSATEQIAVCSGKDAVVCSNAMSWFFTTGLPGTQIACWRANLFTSYGRGHIIAAHLTRLSASFFLLM
ncbi:hypothetical protein Zmor_004336 [Zophobas morio]|uniref:Uncharacterized protein n=1 Tax=Zophobas morio TaxID=2755281 RepID=A0AA38LZL4_9CUCU|nr:hypothetical protein Zmor_004336 [Zophobas morio]